MSRSLQLLFQSLGRLGTTEAQVHHIDLFFDAVFERIDQLADLSAGEKFAGMNFCIGGETADANGRIKPCNHASAVRAVRQRIDGPGTGVGVFVDDVVAMRDVGEVLMLIGSARINDCNAYALAPQVRRQLVEPHGFLSPAELLLLGKIGQ